MQKRRVLVIDDHPDVAEGLGQILELLGCSVTLASSGAEGLRRARELRPDVLFCDVSMPNMDGYAVAAAFRSEAELAAVFLVALTAYHTDEHRRHALEAGFDEHMVKPTELEDIERVLALTCGPA